MRLKVTVETIETEETEEIILGFSILRVWEQQHKRPAMAAVAEGWSGTWFELAHIGYNRKHGKSLTIDEFGEQFDIAGVSAGGGEALPNPSGPAMVPPSD